MSAPAEQREFDAAADLPARAIMTSKIANPICMVDEIERAGESTYNGQLWSAMMPFLESETSARYRETGLDAELDLSRVVHIATANSIDRLPAQLRDRYRVIRIPAPTLADLPALAALVMRDLAAEDESRSHDLPLADDELEIIGRAWAKERFSMRKLQRLISATLEARDACARRH
jgi:ATP-dependent Lon protease